MKKKKSPEYECPCCGYQTIHKNDMRRHLYNKMKQCPKLLHDIELTDEIKEYILQNRIYKQKKVNSASILQKFEKLTIEVNALKHKKTEVFYQAIVEKYLGGTHSKNDAGVTDVTTDNIHAEIKELISFKSAIGQLLSYNVSSPKKELQVYIFNNSNKKKMQIAANIFKELDIKVFTFDVLSEKVDIIEYQTNNIVFTHIL
jgi:hypothetical protein